MERAGMSFNFFIFSSAFTIGAYSGFIPGMDTAGAVDAAGVGVGAVV